MARTTQSAVLSPADKKAQTTALKAEIKASKDGLKALAGERKGIDKAFNDASKAHVAALKVNDKAVAALAKTLAAQDAKLASLSPAVATA